MEEEELCAGPTGALLADNGGCVCFLVLRLEEAPDWGAGAVEVEDARGVHDEGRLAEKLVRPNACRSCTSRLALQARWNKWVILVYSFSLEWSESLYLIHPENVQA